MELMVVVKGIAFPFFPASVNNLFTKIFVMNGLTPSCIPTNPSVDVISLIPFRTEIFLCSPPLTNTVSSSIYFDINFFHFSKFELGSTI